MRQMHDALKIPSAIITLSKKKEPRKNPQFVDFRLGKTLAVKSLMKRSIIRR